MSKSVEQRLDEIEKMLEAIIDHIGIEYPKKRRQKNPAKVRNHRLSEESDDKG